MRLCVAKREIRAAIRLLFAFPRARTAVYNILHIDFNAMSGLLIKKIIYMHQALGVCVYVCMQIRREDFVCTRALMENLYTVQLIIAEFYVLYIYRKTAFLPVSAELLNIIASVCSVYRVKVSNVLNFMFSLLTYRTPELS